MPITNQSSYLPTMNQFIAHWATVNSALQPHPLLLTGAYTLTNFTSDRDELSDAFDAVDTTENEVAAKRNDVLTHKTTLLHRMEQFRHLVNSQLTGTNFVAMLTKLPNKTAIETRFLKPMTRIADLWDTINAATTPGFTPPLKLEGGYTLTMFNADIAALRNAFQMLGTAQVDLSTAQTYRNSLLRPARTRMKQYRNAAQGLLPANSPFLANLPRLSPVAGSTPKAVTNLFYAYNAATNSVHLTFTPSPSANITKYELWFSPGPDWNSVTMEKVMEKDANAPFAFDFPLTEVAEDETALFKVYVFNTTGNERGSKIVRIKRTAAMSLTLSTESETPLLKAA